MAIKQKKFQLSGIIYLPKKNNFISKSPQSTRNNSLYDFKNSSIVRFSLAFE